jgi:hypothetical protein
MVDETRPYAVRRDGLRWKVVRISDDGQRDAGALRFWRKINALRCASELCHAEFTAESALQATFNAAIDFTLDHEHGGMTFLRAWREGDTSEWPEFTEAKS